MFDEGPVVCQAAEVILDHPLCRLSREINSELSHEDGTLACDPEPTHLRYGLVLNVSTTKFQADLP